MKILFDTSALIAFQIESDSHHTQVHRFIEQQLKIESQFFVTDYVLDELFTRLLYDYGARVATNCVDDIEKQLRQQNLTLIPIASDLFELSRKFFLASVAKKLSFTDASTYVVYDRYRLNEICTLDSDFRKVGAQVSWLE